MRSFDPDEEYLTWLYERVASVHLKSRHRSFWTLFRQMYKAPFAWPIPRDENRAHDGVALRSDFCEDTGFDHFTGMEEWLDMPCSVLEVLVSLARRLSVEVDGEPREWFWEFMHNLELDSYNDATRYAPEEVEDILNRLVWRKYSRDGRGGLFPLREPARDQRKVEIWYQAQAYLIENY